MRAEVQRQQQQQGWRKLAYVKWYKAVARPGSDVLSKYGAKLLQEEMEKDPVLGTDVAKCTVIEVDTIINREYIVQDFSTPGRYHVSPFKHKSRATTAAIAVKSGAAAVEWVVEWHWLKCIQSPC